MDCALWAAYSVVCLVARLVALKAVWMAVWKAVGRVDKTVVVKDSLLDVCAVEQ
jgi:hypothetical protein